jgi:small subunit ribosomal protein S17
MVIKKFHRKLKGVVVSNKMRKTIVVAVEEVEKHPKYKKYYTIVKRFKAHDEENMHKVGDHVEIIETRPISKDKRWKVLN